MALDQTLKKAVASASKATKAIQCEVMHFAYVSQSLKGDKVFDPPGGTKRRAIVSQNLNMSRVIDGVPVVVAHTVLFLDPIPPQGTDGRDEPFDGRDEVMLPNGVTGSIVFVSGGVVDPKDKRPYLVEVWMGQGGKQR